MKVFPFIAIFLFISVMSLNAQMLTLNSVQNLLCYNDCSGSFTVSTTGGAVPYQYSLDGGLTTQSSNQFIGLCAGTYTVSVEDNNGSIDSIYVVLSEPFALAFNVNSFDASCNLSCDASIDLSVSGGTPPYTYDWSNGVTTEDIFNLCMGTYQFTIIDANGCVISSFEEVDNENLFEGVINTSTSVPLKNSKVYRVFHNPFDSSLTVIDSTFTDTSGLFSFSNIDTTNNYIKAIPDLILYPNQIPTYYSSSSVFQNADSVNCNFAINFNTIMGVNPGGPGFIAGNIYNGAGKKNGNGQPISNLNLLLFNVANEAVTYTSTDVEGYFAFDNIPCGEYKIWIDDATTDNMLSPTLEISSSDCQKDGLEFKLFNQKLELIETNVAISDKRNDEINFSISPNPTKNHFDLEIDDLIENFSVHIVNSFGQLINVSQIESNNTLISTQNWSNGIYFLSIKSMTGESLAIKKIVISK